MPLPLSQLRELATLAPVLIAWAHVSILAVKAR
jgi:hypothetical protein